METTVLLSNPNNGDDILSTSSYESDFNIGRDENLYADNEKNKDKEEDFIDTKNSIRDNDYNELTISESSETSANKNSDLGFDIKLNNLAVKNGKNDMPGKSEIKNQVTIDRIEKIIDKTIKRNINNVMEVQTKRLVCRVFEKLATENFDNNNPRQSEIDRLTKRVSHLQIASKILFIVIGIVFIKLLFGKQDNGSTLISLNNVGNFELIPRPFKNASNADYDKLSFFIRELSHRNAELKGKYIIDFDAKELIPYLDDNNFFDKAWTAIKGNNDKLNNWLLVNYNNFVQQVNQTLASNATTTK